MGNKNIIQVVQNKLCNSCGACFVVCKADVIKFNETIAGNYFPVINEKYCTNCGLCYDQFLCPAIIEKDESAHIKSTLCLGCGICEEICPENAIKREDL